MTFSFLLINTPGRQLAIKLGTTLTAEDGPKANVFRVGPLQVLAPG